MFPNPLLNPRTLRVSLREVWWLGDFDIDMLKGEVFTRRQASTKRYQAFLAEVFGSSFQCRRLQLPSATSCFHLYQSVPDLPRFALLTQSIYPPLALC